MAKLNNGISGSPRGKFGNLVGFDLNGKHYVKRKAKRTSPATEGELLNQHIFELVQNFVQPLKEVAKVGYRNFSPTYEGVQALFSQVYREALVRNGYDSYIDPERVQISAGSLELSEELAVVYAAEARVLNFTWNPTVGKGKGPRDRVLLAAYNIEQESVFYELCGSQRSEGQAVLNFPAASGTYHIYAAFVSEDRERQSPSLYLGEVEV